MPIAQERLAQRVRNGEQEAWDALWGHLRPQIYSTLGRLLRAVPGMEAEDVLGWTMAEAYRLVLLHDPSRSKVATFVVSGLRGRVQNLRRDALAKGRAKLYLADRPTEDHDPLDVPDPKALERHLRAETWHDIDLALRSLPLRDSH
ncbi:hypothetical protein EON82_21675, partial [bacterium]